MEATRRTVLCSGVGSLSIISLTGCTEGNAEDQRDEQDERSATDEQENTGGSLELLAEEEIDHEHACLHAEFDERTPLEAGESADDTPTVEETHVIWEVTYVGESGYLAFDAASHHYDGPFVFYTAAGTVEVVHGSDVDRDIVGDSCPELDEYLVVEPDDGAIVLEV